MGLRISPAMQSPGNGERPSLRSSAVWVWKILYILYSLEVGVFLLFLPWQKNWENNYLIYPFPVIRAIVANSFLKGAVLGLGIVNILIGIKEIGEFRKSLAKYLSR